MQKYIDKDGEVRAARELLSLSPEELAGEARIDPRFVHAVEGGQDVVDGPALRNLFGALERLAVLHKASTETLISVLSRRLEEARTRDRDRETDVAKVRAGAPTQRSAPAKE